MHPMLNIAVRAARAAGDHALHNLAHIDSLKIESKQRNDFVSDVDRVAEHAIITILRKAYPDHAILAEESGQHDGNEFQWIIDPLDGTTNFLHGIPHFAVSIALHIKGRAEIALVYDPVKQELFTAEKGRGTQLNNRRIRVSSARQLDGALLATGFPFRDSQDPTIFLKVLRDFMEPTAGIRRAGAASLDLAYIAAGRFDGFWETGLSSWDMAAGAMLVQEAGGSVTDIHGEDQHLNTGGIVAANPKIHKAMLEVIKPYAKTL